jgi:hypothetical protein
MIKPIFVMCCLALVTGCVLDSKNIGSPEEETTTESTGAPSTSETIDPTSEGGETSPSTGVTDTVDMEFDTGSETAATEPGPVCEEPGPGAPADFVMALEGWPHGVDDSYAYDVPCTIDGVSGDDATVTTTMTCDVEGSPLVGSFAIPTAAEGEVDWAAGQSVSLHVVVLEDEIGAQMELRVTLAEDPAALLVDADRWVGDSVPTGAYMIGPILREVAEICVSGEDQRFELRYSLTEGASVSIPSGQSGALEIDEAHAFAIAVEYSEEGCCHGRERILIRRVKTG